MQSLAPLLELHQVPLAALHDMLHDTFFEGIVFYLLFFFFNLTREVLDLVMVTILLVL